MGELIKIREISLKYDISARALKYYEDMGLISSTRSDDYAYRMYDAEAVTRIEQILVLRKLNISIKDIQRIFATSGSETVLEVLGNKVSAIDDEVALLHELKEIVLEFVHQIENSDFNKESDVKRLYEKAKEIETQIVNVDYTGNPSKIHRLFEVTEKLNHKVPDVMIVKIQKFRALSSGYQTFDELFKPDGFEKWRDEHGHFFQDVIFDSADFMWQNGNGEAIWVWGVKDEITEEDVLPYEIIDCTGGLYASAVCIDGDGESMDNVRGKIIKWLENTNFIYDYSRPEMAHVIYPHEDIKQGLGYNQLQRYIPIKLKGEKATTAFFVGTWPLTDAHDPALDEANIPEGTAIFGLFDSDYNKYSEPKDIPNLKKVSSSKEMTKNTYYVLNARSGFDYIIVKADSYDALEIRI